MCRRLRLAFLRLKVLRDQSLQLLRARRHLLKCCQVLDLWLK